MASLNRGHQENICVLVCWDDKYASIIRGALDITLFEFPYNIICEKAYEYIDAYGSAPKDHVHDILIDYLDKQKPGRKKQITKKLKDLYELSLKGVNRKYTMDTLNGFVRQQTLKQGIIDAAESIKEGDEKSIDKAEEILAKSMHRHLELFDPGLFLNDASKGLEFLDRDTDHFFLTGIDELDARNCGPVRGGVHLFIGTAKAGKSWWLCNLGYQTALQHNKVVHISLELSEIYTFQRYYQTIFCVALREGDIDLTLFDYAQDGKLEGFKFKNVIPKLRIDDPKIRSKLSRKAKKFDSLLENIVIKRLPEGETTIRNIESYLDNLAASKGFIPDLIIIDYPDKMKIDINNYRLSLGALYVDIHRLAEQRNVAVAIASQSNRPSEGAKVVQGKNVAEDYSKIGTVDLVMTYSKTESEESLNLARLTVTHGRHDDDKFTVLLSQNYKMGQFVIDSYRMGIPRKHYFDIIDEELGVDN